MPKPRNPDRQTVEVPRPLMEELRAEAARQRMTVTTAANVAIREWLSREQKIRRFESALPPELSLEDLTGEAR